MEQESTQPTMVNHALKWGLISGSVSIVLMVILYVVDYSLMVDWKTGLSIIAVSLGIVIYAGIDYRNSIGGYMPYGKAWQHGFIVFAVSGLVYTIFNFILHNVIDPELAVKLVDAGIEKQQAMMEGFGVPEDQMEKAMADAKKQLERQFTPVGMLIGFGIGLVINAVLAAITAIFVRRNEPIENM